MTLSICTLCSTELLDNMIHCAGRCNKYFHYACAGFSRTSFDGYKKVSGLKWQCSECIDEFNRLWTKLDGLTDLVNEIKMMINLSGLVKSTIKDIFNEGFAGMKSTAVDAVQSISKGSANKNKKKKKRQNNLQKQNRKAESSPPVNSIFPPVTKSQQFQEPFPYNSNETHEVSSNATVVQSTLQMDISNDRLSSTMIERSHATNLPPNVSVSNVSNHNFDIRVAEKRSYLWLSGFHHTSTAKQVISLVSKLLTINESDIICRSLKSSKREYNDFQHISFRIGLKSSDIKDAFQPNKWPEGIICKYFNQKN